MGERRSANRQRSLLRGRILFNNRRNSVDCVIRDISGTGARVVFSTAVTIPDVVDIYIPQKEQTLRAVVQWRRGEEVGLAFGATAAPTAEQAVEPGDLATRVARLESELAAMKRLLKRVKLDPAADDAA